MWAKESIIEGSKSPTSAAGLEEEHKEKEVRNLK
jgi:hypothetical protein